MEALIVDLFAGGGGASIGIEAAFEAPVDLAINHSPVAIAVHKANHPHTKHFTSDIWEVDPIVACRGRPVLYLHASPDCTHFSRAKGNVPKSQNIRSLADVVIVWAEKVRPLVITLENVPEFPTWGPLCDDDSENRGRPIKERAGETFAEWVGKLRALGYVVDYRVLDASEYGAPTKRRRFFLVARRDGLPITWPETTHGPGKLPLHTAAECIDWSIPCPSIFERKKPLAEKTLRRIAAGIRRFVLENPSPYLVGNVAPSLIQTGYGERPGQRPRVLDLHAPIGTLVDGQKHALVSAFLAKHFGGVVGQSLERPIGTITSIDHHSLAAVSLAKFRGTSDAHTGAASTEDPLATISAGGNHFAEVRAFLAAYYGEHDIGQVVDEPLRTVTTRDRFGLVVVDGIDHVIVDIGMRMLQPHELLKAQFGRFAATYDLSAAKTKSAKVKLIGNSVCPEVMEALARANLPRPLLRRAA